MAQTEVERLEQIKSVIDDIKGDLKNYIDDKFDDILATIDERIEDLEDDDVYFFGRDEAEENNDADHDLSIQERIDQSLLSQTIANQLQTVEDEVPVVQIEAAPSLTDIIGAQLPSKSENETKPVELSTVIADQIEAKKNLTVVAPVTVEEITAKAAPRSIGEIIADLRSGINTHVESTTQALTNDLVQRAVSPALPEIDGDQSEDLALKISTQLVSNEIKKQLS
ncbi:hypothetical protein ABFV99_13950 [Cytobacillus horneckiae]|uniref:hypothetical protein n=1 Tax=Cytobacillus horneckiae TaxID=549687 RepID=UPI0034CF4E2C